MPAVHKKQRFILRQHHCAYDLEQERCGPYLTGSYVCSVCGNRKPVSSRLGKQFQRVLPDILMQWKQSLSDEILMIEDRYTALRGYIVKAGSAEAHMKDSAQLIEKTIASCRDTLHRFEVNADILQRSERFLKDRGGLHNF